MVSEKHTPAGAPIVNCDDTDACETVSCATCLEEVPADIALTAEGPDYVQYFCGLDCLAQWRKKVATNG